MGNMVIPALLVVFIFGAVCGYINDTGIYSGIALPVSSANLSTGSVTELTENMQSVEASDFSFIEWLTMGGRAIIAGVIAIFTLGPLLQSFGLPVGMAGMFISPLALIVLLWVISYFTGRESE